MGPHQIQSRTNAVKISRKFSHLFEEKFFGKNYKKPGILNILKLDQLGLPVSTGSIWIHLDRLGPCGSPGFTRVDLGHLGHLGSPGSPGCTWVYLGPPGFTWGRQGSPGLTRMTSRELCQFAEVKICFCK